MVASTERLETDLETRYFNKRPMLKNRNQSNSFGSITKLNYKTSFPCWYKHAEVYIHFVWRYIEEVLIDLRGANNPIDTTDKDRGRQGRKQNVLKNTANIFIHSQSVTLYSQICTAPYICEY